VQDSRSPGAGLGTPALVAPEACNLWNI